MTTAPPTGSTTERVRNGLGGVPVDLVAVSVLAVALSLLLPGTGEGYSLLRALVGLVFVLVFPGYALLSATFPGRPTGTLTNEGQSSAYSPGTAERLVLSFVFSLALLPLLAVGHGALAIPFEPETIVASVTVVVVVFSAIGVVRRLALPPGQRYSPPSVVDRANAFLEWTFAGGTVDTLLSIVLVVTVVLAVGALSVGFTEPTQGDVYTSVSLVSENEDGELVASNYPTNITAGEGENLTLQVENNYETTGNYTAVIELQRVQGQGSESLDLVDRERLGTLSSQVRPNETWTRTHTVEPTMRGEELRLVYYVYRGDVPETPNADEAEETAQLWVTVQ